jgi:hypothetical protein
MTWQIIQMMWQIVRWCGRSYRWYGRPYADVVDIYWTDGIWCVLAANGNATRGPIKGRHVSLVYLLKNLHLVGVDPMTSGGRVKIWERSPNRNAHACSLLYMFHILYLTLL